MPRVRVKIDGVAAADRLADISTEFPDAEFKVLAVQPRNDTLLEIVEVSTPDSDTLVHQLEESEVRSYEVLHIDAETVLLQLIIPVSDSYNAVRAAKTLPNYPVTLRDGWFSGELIASQEQLSEYSDELAAADLPHEIVSVTQSYDPSELLTDRQWEFIIEAVEQGYYDTPRGCTLTELAETLDINKSAASKLHHRTESRIITQFVAEAA